jgi:hypothetical protein
VFDWQEEAKRAHDAQAERTRSQLEALEQSNRAQAAALDTALRQLEAERAHVRDLQRELAAAQVSACLTNCGTASPSGQRVWKFS